MSTKNDTSISHAATEEVFEPFLFELPPRKPKQPLVPILHEPIWTQNKARLIEEYLHLFTLITKHGTYIDGFAGPQEPDKLEMWSANLVLKNELLQHFYLFEQNPKSILLIEKLKQANSSRHIKVFPGDFNVEILKLLKSGEIGRTEATFCLLDQRTFECHWKSIEMLAQYKTSGLKIELFYFLANQWLPRAFSALGDKTIAEQWWERSDWITMTKLDPFKRVQTFMERFKSDLQYKYVTPWPIREKQDGGGHLMYYMIHASDHFEAPKLMRRAYDNAVRHKDLKNQLQIIFR